MDNTAERNILLFGGIVSLVFGVLLFTQPTATLALIMLLVGLSWFIQGIVTLVSVFIDKAEWGWKLFGGIIGMAAGLLVLRNPVESTVAIPAIYAILLGIFGLLIGIAALIGAFRGEGWGIGIFGLISLVIGLAMMFNSVVGGAVLVWLTALLLVIQGAVGVFWSLARR
jgi:uncharacterized membrane protein HdeD (DUF308 family)